MATTVGTLLVNVIGNASGLKSTLDSAESTIAKFGSGMTRMGTRWTAGISLPIAGLLTGIGKVGVEFDRTMTESLAIMGHVDDGMRQRMQDRAMELSEKLKFSSKEVAEGYYDLASAGFDAQGALDNIGTVATFAQAGLMKMGTAGEYLAGAVKALGPDLIGTADDAAAMARVADVLTSANNNALGTVEDFSQALTTRFASGMKQANMSLEEGVGFLMAYAQQNIKGKDASMQAWMALRDVQTKAITAADAWRDLGISVFDANKELRPMPDILDQINMRMKGFSKGQIKAWLETGAMPDMPEGKPMAAEERRKFMIDLKLPDRSVASLQKVLGEGDTIRSFVEKLKDSMGEAEKVAAKQGEAIGTKLLMAWHKIENQAIKLFENAKPIILDFLNTVTGWLDVLDVWVAKFNALDEPTRKWILQLAALAVVAGPALWFTGTMVQLLGSLVPVLSATSNMFMGLAGSMLKYVNNGTLVMRNAKGQFTSIVPKGATAAIAQFMGYLTKTWGVIKTTASWVTFFGTRLLALYGIVEGAVRPMLGWLGTDTKKWADMLTGIFPPLAAIRLLWEKFSFSVSMSIGTWDEWKETLGRVLHMLGNLWEMIKFGWSLIPQYFAAIGETAMDMARTLVRVVGEWITSFFNMAKAVKDFVLGIPVIGPVIQGTFAFLSLIFGEFWAVVKTVFGWILRMSGGVGKALYETLAPKWLQGTVGWMYEVATGAKSIHEAVKTADNDFNNWLHSIGAIDLKARNLTGTFEGLRTAMGRTGKDSTIMGVDIPGAAGPPTAQPPGPVRRDPVKEAYDELMGDGGRKWRDVAKAVELHKKEIFANADAMDRLWEIYKGVRETIGPNGLTKELDGLFATRIGLEDIEKIKESFGDLFNDLFNNGETQTALEKNLSLIGAFVRERQALLADAGAAGGGIFSPEFFKKYGADIEQLNKYYGTQSAEVRVMIDEYLAWQAVMEKTERSTANLARANETLTGILSQHADMTAQLADKQKEFGDLQLTEGERTIRGLSRNMEQQAREFDIQNAKMLDSFKHLEGEKLGIALDTFFKTKAMQEEFLQLILRSDMQRAASAMGVDAKVIRSFKHMTTEKIKLMLQERAAATKIAQNYYDIASAISDIASVTDEGGNKTITWLAEMGTLMGDAKMQATAMREAMAGMQAALAKGDWGAFASGAISAFQQIAKGIVILDKATSSLNRWQATMGGAAAGAQMGSAFGGWGALIGGAIGGIVGFFRSGARAAEEARRKFAELQQKYKDTMKEFADSHPELKELTRILEAFGVTLGQVNTEADLANVIAQLQEFENKLIDVRGKFEDLLGQANELGIGLPAEIEAAINHLVELGIITGETAAMWGKMLGAGEVSWTKMKEAADRIGLAEDKLGKAYQQARMDAMAKSLINDFDILQRGGASTIDIIDAMADEINALVLDSIKFGTTIPENMRPWVEELLKSGRLVDENGKKLENLDGINFGPPVKTQFEEITLALKELIEELKKLPGLFANLGGSIPKPDMPDLPGGPHGPGENPRNGDGGRSGEGPKNSLDLAGADMAASRVALTAGRIGSVGNTATSSANGGGGQTVIVLPVAVGDATSVEDLADLALSRLPEGIVNNTSNIKYAIISAARATSVPRTRRR